MIFFSTLAIQLATLSLVSAKAISRLTSEPTCRDVNFRIPFSVDKYQVPADIAALNPYVYANEAISDLINIPVSGNYSIYGRYCEPAVLITGNFDVLQLLVHGASRDHHYWDAYDFDGSPVGGSNNSWVFQASQHGYPTLAIDRLGDGLSSHPNPNTTVQLPAHAAIINQLATQIMSGVLQRKFEEVVFVGHSQGSVIGQLVATRYPNTFTRIILTGWAQVNYRMLATNPSYGVTSGPAREIDPARFSSLPYGYLTTANKTYDGLMTYYRYGTPSAPLYFDYSFSEAVFPHRQTLTTGELYTLVLAIEPALGYGGKVLVLTGQNDGYWCGPAQTADCGSDESSPIATGRYVFPVAESYDYYSPAHTGHELLYHFSANGTYARLWSWMQSSA